MVLLKVENLDIVSKKKIFWSSEKNNRIILKNISLEILKKSFTTLIGESGSGKSMLARGIVGLLPQGVFASKGRFFFKEKEVSKACLGSLRGKNILYIPQNSSAALNPVLKIKNQLNHGASGMITEDNVRDRFKACGFDSPSRILNSYPFELSQGECQRCLQVITQLIKPSLLILDEPISSLDHELKIKVLKIILTMKQDMNLTILCLTHNLDLAYQYSDRIYVLKKGTIVESGGISDIFLRPKHIYTKNIIAEYNNSPHMIN